MVLNDILQHCGLPGRKLSTVSGGDINDAYCVDTGEQKFFLKVNDAAAFPGMMQKESVGLATLHSTHTIKLPCVIQDGIISGKQFLLIEWLEKGIANENSMKNFGRAMASLHSIKQAYFGFDTDNYIGSLPQLNSKHEYWHSFYSECRIMPLVKKLFDAGNFSNVDR